MVALGTDELSTSLSPAAIKAAGYRFVCLYERVLTPAICQEYLAAGLGLIVIFEYEANRSLGGLGVGHSDGALFAARLSELGVPHGCAAAVNLADFAPAPDQMSAIAAYWQAFIGQAGSWQLMGYATGWVINQLSGLGINTKYWQNPMDNNGWPGSTLAPAAVMVQRVQATIQVAGVQASEYDEDAYYGTGLIIWGVPVPLKPVSSNTGPGNPPLNGCVALLNTPSGQGYWLVQPDGGVFSHGDAQFWGSAGGMKLNAPIVGAAVRPLGDGYWLVGADGGVFCFGRAGFFGSLGSTVLNKPVKGITATPDGGGYRIYAADGGVFDFGPSATFQGAGQ